MKNKKDYPETVMLIDAMQLNDIVTDFKKNFEERLQRPLHGLDMAQFVVNLASDAGMSGGKNEAHVVFLYDKSMPELKHCFPSGLETELNGVAFKDRLGEFNIDSLSPEDIVSPEDLFFDLLRAVNGLSDVKRIICVPFEQDNRQKIHSALEEIKGKEVTLFSMAKPEETTGYVWRILAFPVMQAMGIKGSEIL